MISPHETTVEKFYRGMQAPVVPKSLLELGEHALPHIGLSRRFGTGSTHLQGCCQAIIGFSS